MPLLKKLKNRTVLVNTLFLGIGLLGVNLTYAFDLRTLQKSDQLSIPVQNILKLLNEDPTLAPDQALQIFTKKYGRKPKEERSAIQPQDILEQKKESLLPQLKDLNMVEGTYPPQNQYDYIIILGATLETMRERTAYFNQLLKQNQIHITPPTKLFVAAGKRALFPQESALKSEVPFRKNWHQTQPLPTDEIEGAAWIIDQIIQNKAARQRFIILKTPKRFDEDQKQ